MNRRLRLLSVAAVAQALLGLAVVATDAPTRTDTTLDARRDGRAGSVVPDHDDRTPPPGDGPVEAVPGPVPGLHPTVTTARAGGAKGSPATTAAPGGTTSTSVTGGTSTTTTTGPGGPRCPDPRTCDVYEVIDEHHGGPYGGTKGWRPGADGVVRIPFYVKPTPPVGSNLTEATMEAAHIAGTKIIEAQNPRIRFEYRGRTPDGRVPERFDGFNDFQFGGKPLFVFDSRGHIVEADIRPSTGTPAGDWAYTPCEQRDDSCGRSGRGKREILTLIVHEQFHTVGGADLYGAETTELTLHAAGGDGDDRDRVTPGLGDVLLLRALYPTSAPMPPIYSP